MAQSKTHPLLSATLGIAELILCGIWVYHYANLLYSYRNYPDLLRPFVVDENLIFMHIASGLVGMVLGFRLLQRKANLTIALVIPLILFAALTLWEDFM
ncbi:MAG: hypothetical protein SchgKO_19590 [Schleiferiaceae bacterium]